MALEVKKEKLSKKDFIFILMVCFLYYSLLFYLEKYGPKDEITSTAAVIFILSFPLLSILLGIFISIKSKKVFLPSLLWLVYSILLEIILNSGIAILSAFIFLIFALGSNIYLFLKTKKQKTDDTQITKNR